MGEVGTAHSALLPEEECDPCINCPKCNDYDPDCGFDPESTECER